MNETIGQPVDRVDGRFKTTGAASYAAEFSAPSLVFAVTTQSTIASGRIRTIDTARATTAPGVLSILTHQNTPKLKRPSSSNAEATIKYGERELLPLQSDRIYYDGQHIAVVVAETFEAAEHAASLIEVEYEVQPAVLNLDESKDKSYEPKESMGRPLQLRRGKFEDAWRDAPVKIHHTYSTPVYHHNPMEPHATVAVWEADHLTIYDSTQSVIGNRDAIAEALGIPANRVRLICPFVGGGFGCKGFTWAHSMLAPLAAMVVKRPVKLVLDRQQMFTCNGHRSQTIQEISLGASTAGVLTALDHSVLAETSFVDEFVETAGLPTQRLYACPNVRISHKLVRVHRGTPTPTRAPGEAPGTFALESALDELADRLQMDPIELRLINYAERDPQNGKPWSLKNLKECYRRGADAIGWSHRTAPGFLQEGDCLIGYGMATAIYPANRVPASAKVRILADGHALGSSCTQDIGTGTYTTMAQIIADTLGLPIDRVEFKLGDTNLPKAPVSGGSQTSASVGPAVKLAARSALEKLLRLATSGEGSPLTGLSSDNLTIENGRCFLKTNPSRGESFAETLARHQAPFVEGEATTKGTTREGGNKETKPSADKPGVDAELDSSGHSFQSFGAQFARVSFDPQLATVRVTHCAAVMDIGKVLNLKTARNQIMGGMVFGLGMALMEETIYDRRRGRVVTRDLANYRVPVHADIPEMDVHFIGQPDPHINSIGARGIGEIGITGITAAIANAIYNASGKRIRDLPITPDKLI